MNMLWLSLRTGLVELWAHKTRSLLSLLSVAIGAGVFLSSFASIYHAHARVRRSLALSGEGRFTIQTSYSQKEEDSLVLNMQDLYALRRAMPWLYMIYPLDDSWQNTEFEDGSKVDYSYYLGITPDWRKRDWQYQLEGRFIDDYDVENAARVCLLVVPGAMRPEQRALYKVYTKNQRWLTGYKKYVTRNVVRLGSKIKAGHTDLTVIGLLREPSEEDDERFIRGMRPQVIVPFTTHNLLTGGGRNRIDQIVMDTGNARRVEQAKKITHDVLESRHGPVKELKIEDLREALELQMNQTIKTAMSTLALGLAALLAGGIGIMNVTLAIVFSRIKEIGIRRAIGATRGEIIMQFLTETLLLGFFGGIIGIALGYYGVGNIMLGDFSHASKLTWWMPLISIVVAMMACLVFSLLPAYRAAKLDPVEALRTE